jgi:hypothetical protein
LTFEYSVSERKKEEKKKEEEEGKKQERERAQMGEIDFANTWKEERECSAPNFNSLILKIFI